MNRLDILKSFPHFYLFRDGSAVEIVGLCKSVLHWLVGVYTNGDYRYSAVTRRDDQGMVFIIIILKGMTECFLEFQLYLQMNTSN